MILFFKLDTDIYQEIVYFLKHLEATGDKRLKGFNLRNDPDPKSSQHKVQQVIVDNQTRKPVGFMQSCYFLRNE